MLVGLALVWVTGAVYVIHSNRHEVGALNSFTVIHQLIVGGELSCSTLSFAVYCLLSQSGLFSSVHSILQSVPSIFNWRGLKANMGKILGFRREDVCCASRDGLVRVLGPWARTRCWCWVAGELMGG